MYSPFKLCEFDKNYHYIESNINLADRLNNFFKFPGTRYMWKLNTTRQTVTKELKNTEMIGLRRPLAPNEPRNTAEWNDVTNIIDTELLKNVPIFRDTYRWLETTLGRECSKIEFGRIFFSKHFANSDIDIHTDEGAYFNYYDRFHFVISQEDNKNIFHIRDEDVLLQTGKLYWVNNHVPHWLKNNSDQDRINLIVDARLI